MRFYTLLGDLEVSAIFSDLVDEFLPIYPTVVHREYTACGVIFEIFGFAV